MNQQQFVFPEGFLWGSATSAHQVEGDNMNSDWWAWENSKQRREYLKQKGGNIEDFFSGKACDFYHSFEADFDLAKSLNQNAFRLSVEWARIEPQEGKYDHQALAHYKEVLQALKVRGFKTFVTLHHFTSPAWFMACGGFLKQENVVHFLEYSRLVAESLGDLVDFWITINEPEIYSSHAYFVGSYPPQMKSFRAMIKVAKNLILAHNLAAAQLHKICAKPVSMAYHLTDLVPSSFWSKLTRNIIHYLINEYVLNRTIGSCDYIGLNYYGHSHVGVWGRRMESASHHAVSDLGWGIHPEGLERVLLNLKKYRKPVYITENGIADAKDDKREKFIKDHLYYAYKAIGEGVDVRGYLYWSLLDNFEWHHGFAPRFGLVEVDYKTLARKIRKSAYAYAEICKTNTLTI